MATGSLISPPTPFTAPLKRLVFWDWATDGDTLLYKDFFKTIAAQERDKVKDKIDRGNQIEPLLSA